MNNLKCIRKAKSMTQMELSKASGVDRSHIIAIEKNDANTTISTILKLATALDCSIAELIQDKEKPPN